MRLVHGKDVGSYQHTSIGTMQIIAITNNHYDNSSQYYCMYKVYATSMSSQGEETDKHVQ